MIASFSDRGKVLAGSRLSGGSRADSVRCAVAIADDRWLVAGSTSSFDLTAVGAGSSAERAGATDVLLMTCSITSTGFLTLLGGAGADDVGVVVLDANKDVICSGTTTSPTIDLADRTVEGFGATDGFVLRWAFGALQLTAPRGGERLCVGQTITLNWNVDEMAPSERFTLERSRDARTWTPIASKITGRSFIWSPTDADMRDSAVYVRVRTDRGHASRSDDLIRVDPAVTAEPLPRTIDVCADRAVSIAVDAQGVGLRYQWRRNGVSTTRTGAVLAFESFDPSTDVGTWDCAVSGACGQTIVVGPMTIRAVGPVAITEQPAASTTANEGGLVRISVAASGAQSFAWTREGASDVLGTAPTLTFNAVRVADAGRYVCHVSDGCDTVTSSVAEIVVVPVTVEEGPEAGGLWVGPLPAESVITVRSSEPMDAVSVVDLAGRVMGIRYSSVEPTLYILDVAELPTGVYVLVVKGLTGQSHRAVFTVR
jgi:hypothetical protein